MEIAKTPTAFRVWHHQIYFLRLLTRTMIHQDSVLSSNVWAITWINFHAGSLYNHLSLTSNLLKCMKTFKPKVQIAGKSINHKGR